MAGCLVFLIMTGWVFSGWPRVLEKPAVPPQVEEVKAGSGDVILFWAGAEDAPLGWSCISCTGGDAYYERFPQGASSYGSTGGDSTHTHTISFVSHGAPTGTGKNYPAGTANYPDDPHTHPSISSESMDGALALPPYYELKVIYANAPSTIPTGVIAIFTTTTLPSGDWQLYSSADNYIIRGGSNAESSASQGHTHSNVTFVLDGASGTTTGDTKSKTGEQVYHRHTVSGGTTDPADQLPPYIEVVLMQTTATTSLADGMVAMFNDDPPVNWTEVSAINDSKFIRADSTGYGATGGTSTHSHANTGFDCAATTDTVSTANDTAVGGSGAPIGHIHTATTSFGSATNIPPYRNTVFAQYSAPANNPPSISSVSLAPSPIILNENGTTTATCTVSATDQQGGNTIASSTASVYRSGVGNTCGQDDNNCYPNITFFASSSSGNNYYATWTVDIWFHAEPTDTSAPTYSGEWWECYVVLEDDGSETDSATNSAETIEVNTLNALVITSSLDYGLLGAGATSTASVTTTATSTGNAAIDVKLSGLDMSSNGYTIPVGQQEYATSSLSYGDGIDLTGSLVTLEVDLSKPDTAPSTSTDDILWRIGIPPGQQTGTYYGTTTVVAVAD